jgi:hypothetical protein
VRYWGSRSKRRHALLGMIALMPSAGLCQVCCFESVWFWGEPLEVWVPLRYAPPMEHAITPPNVYQFRVVLQGISPFIWRRLLIPSDMSLATLHAALQIVFAWSDTSLHSFHIHGQAYGTPGLEGPHIDVDGECLILGGSRRHLLRSCTEPRIPLPECRLPVSI